MTPGSAQQAAMRILLEDIEPLVQRTEELADTLKVVQVDLHSNLETLSAMVQQGCNMQPVLLDLGRTLTGAAGRIERLSRDVTARAGAEPATVQGIARSWLFAAMLASALLSSAILALAAATFGPDMLEHVRAGRALQRAWPTLDADTRAKVQHALERR
jgi:hypothetical protein